MTGEAIGDYDIRRPEAPADTALDRYGLTDGGRAKDQSPQESRPTRDHLWEIGEKPSTLNVYVTRLPSTDDVELIVQELQNRYPNRDDGYFVSIACEPSGHFESANRLTKRQVRRGSHRAVGIWLEDGDSEIPPIITLSALRPHYLRPLRMLLPPSRL